MAKSFRELKVWNRAIELTTLVYALTAEFPKAEVYGLSSQMRRAAVSIASNIAEGSARGTRKDFKQFVAIARGSNSELQTQLVIAGRLGFIDVERNRSCGDSRARNRADAKWIIKVPQFVASSLRGRLTTDN
jgi:four helix bundle protein